MSLECSECEHDLRGGHAQDCSRRQRPKTATHECPCGCGSRVPNRLFACKPGWYRLPVEMRNAISLTAGASPFDDERAAIVGDAVEWYLMNPVTR